VQRIEKPAQRGKGGKHCSKKGKGVCMKGICEKEGRGSKWGRGGIEGKGGHFSPGESYQMFNRDF